MSEFKSWDELTRNEQLHAEYYDFYKEVHGIRPRWIFVDGGEPAYTEQEMDDMLLRLVEESKAVFAEEERRQQEAVIAFELRVEQTIDSGAKDRQTAVRWIIEAEGQGYEDLGYVEYCLGIPYGYLKKVVDQVAA